MQLYYLSLLLAQIMVGIGIVGSKYLIYRVPLLFLLTLRFCLAAMLLFMLHQLTYRKKDLFYQLRQLTRQDKWFILAQAICAGALFNLLMLLGLHYTDASVAGIITSALPALVAVLSFIILKEKCSLRKAMVITLATLGLLTVSASQLHMPQGHYAMLGNFIVFLALLPEASYYILSQLCPNKLPIFFMSGLINAINAILLLPTLWFTPAGALQKLDLMDWMILILISASSALFYVFWYKGSAKIDGIMASLSTALMPIATVIIAWLTLGEVIHTTQIIGMGLVISSIFAYSFL